MLVQSAPLLELAGVATLSSWIVLVAVGFGLCPPDRALAMGVPGTFLGNVWFAAMGWPSGPLVLGHPVLPGLVGTALIIVVSAYSKQLLEVVVAHRPPKEDREVLSSPWIRGRLQVPPSEPRRTFRPPVWRPPSDAPPASPRSGESDR